MHVVRNKLCEAAVVAVSVLTAACGGTASPLFFDPVLDDAGNAADASPPDDAFVPPIDATPPVDATTPWSPACPAARPATGTTCARENLTCEYAYAPWNVACSVVVQCENTQWWSYQPSFDRCTPAPGPNSAACPAAYAGVKPGAACTNLSLACVYPQGLCSCQSPLGGPYQPDAAVGYGSWVCLPEQGCPFPRPRLGTSCPTEGTFCTYEECNYAQTCTGGVWQSQQAACGGLVGGTPARAP